MDVICAAQEGDLARLKELVTRDNVDDVDDDGCSALHWACQGSHVHVVSFLVGVGADVNARDLAGDTPLHYAAASKDAACLRLLLDANAKAECSSKFRSIALHHVAYSAECAALLVVAHPAGVFAVDRNGRTPLHLAAEHGRVEVLRVLLDAGSSVDIVDNNGHSPLYWALCNRRRDVAELLLGCGSKLEHIKLDSDLKAIPDWTLMIVASLNACRSSCWAVLGLAKRRSRVIGRNSRDVLGLISRIVWACRLHYFGP